MEDSKEKIENSENNEIVDQIILKHVYASIGVGLIPIPVIDMLGLAGVQINMLRMLANQYNIPFAEEKVKNIAGPLLGAGIATGISSPFASLLKILPIIGQTTGILSMSALGGAATYALGKVFDRHFSTGGTFLTFDTEKAKEFYAQKIKEGEEFVSDIKDKMKTKKESKKKSEKEELTSTKADEKDIDLKQEKQKDNIEKIIDKKEDKTDKNMAKESTETRDP